MRDNGLRFALKNEVYEHIGKSNRGLLQQVLRDEPHLGGASVGAAVLRKLEVPQASEATRNPEWFFEDWVREQGGGETPKRRHGLLPDIRKLRLPLVSGKEEDMDSENLKWVGLAVLVAVAGGVLSSLLRRHNDENTRERAPTPLPPKPTPKAEPIRLAVAIFAGKLPSGELDVTGVADLVARATYWWVGTPDSWIRTGGEGIVEPLRGAPTSDDALIVLLVDMPEAAERSPTSRPEASSQLRAAASRREAVLVGQFVVTDASALTSVGFRR